MGQHPVVQYTSEASWAMVMGQSVKIMLANSAKQVEDKFSAYGKEVLANLILFLEVCLYGLHWGN